VDIEISQRTLLCFAWLVWLIIIPGLVVLLILGLEVTLRC